MSNIIDHEVDCQLRVGSTCDCRQGELEYFRARNAELEAKNRRLVEALEKADEMLSTDGLDLQTEDGLHFVIKLALSAIKPETLERIKLNDEFFLATKKLWFDGIERVDDRSCNGCYCDCRNFTPETKANLKAAEEAFDKLHAHKEAHPDA